MLGKILGNLMDDLHPEKRGLRSAHGYRYGACVGRQLSRDGRSGILRGSVEIAHLGGFLMDLGTHRIRNAGTVA